MGYRNIDLMVSCFLECLSLFSNYDICLSFISKYLTYHFGHLSILDDLSNLSPLACPELFQWNILCFPIGAMPHNFNSINYGPCCHHNGDDSHGELKAKVICQDTYYYWPSTHSQVTRR